MASQEKLIKKVKELKLFAEHWEQTQLNIWEHINKYENHQEILEDPIVLEYFENLIANYRAKNNFSDSLHRLHYLKKAFKKENFSDIYFWAKFKEAWLQEWKVEYLSKAINTKNKKWKAFKYFTNIETFSNIKSELENLKDHESTNVNLPNKFDRIKKWFIDQNLVVAFQKKNNHLLDFIFQENKDYTKREFLDVFAYSGTNNSNPLNVSQLIALQGIHKHHLTNIKGPPGTGKTTLLKDVVVSLLLNNQTIEITSSNNEAVDNVLQIFQKDKILQHLPILRLGNIENCQKTYEAIFENYNFNHEQIKCQNKSQPKPINDLIDELIQIKNVQEAHANKKSILKFINPLTSVIDDLQSLTLNLLKKKRRVLEKIFKKITEINYRCPKWRFIALWWNHRKHRIMVKELKEIWPLLCKPDVFVFGSMSEEMILHISWGISELESLIFAKKQEQVKNEKKILHQISKTTLETQEAIKKIITNQIKEQEKHIKTIRNYIVDAANRQKTKNQYQNQGENLYLEGKILRSLYCGEIPYGSKEQFARNKLRELFPISLTTTLTANNFQSIEKTDYCIIDEAAQTTIHSVLGITHNFNNMVLLGDTSQLDAVVTLNKQKEAAIFEQTKLPNVYRNIKNSVPLIIENILPPSISFMLNEHWRCVPAIANFFNRYYGYQLIMKRDGHNVNRHMQLDVYQNDFREKIKELEQEYEFIINATSQKVALISPFKSINKLQTQIVKKGTIHKFQGYENDVIIYYINNRQNITPFLIKEFLDDQLINVAVSRAKNKFHLVIPEKAYRVIQQYKESQMYSLINYIEQNKVIDAQMFYSQLDSWNKVDIQNLALTESSYYIAHIKKDLFLFLQTHNLFITFGVRDIDVNKKIKHIRDHILIYDMVIFDLSGNICVIIHNQRIIYSKLVRVDELLILGFKENIDQQLINMKKIMTEREKLYFKKIIHNLKPGKTILPTISMKKILPQVVRKFHFDLVFVDYYCHQDYYYYEYKFILELDDATHLTQKAQIGDTKKNEICQKHQIKLLRLKI